MFRPFGRHYKVVVCKHYKILELRACIEIRTRTEHPGIINYYRQSTQNSIGRIEGIALWGKLSTLALLATLARLGGYVRVVRPSTQLDHVALVINFPMKSYPRLTTHAYPHCCVCVWFKHLLQGLGYQRFTLVIFSHTSAMSYYLTWCVITTSWPVHSRKNLSVLDLALISLSLVGSIINAHYRS